MKDTFWGQAKITGDESKNLREVKESWNRFNDMFWGIFIGHIIIKAFMMDSSSLTTFYLQLLPIIAMVILMGYFAYKFSGKRTFGLYGLLGLIWVALIGIFIGYFAVRRLRNKAAKDL